MGVARYSTEERAILLHVGKAIARRRRHRGWTQAELGVKCGEAFQVVQKWECGETAISVPQLCAVAWAFNVAITAFLPEKFQALAA